MKIEQIFLGVLGVLLATVGFFLRAFYMESKKTKHDLEAHKREFEEYKRETAQIVGKLKGNLELTEQGVNAELKALKEISALHNEQMKKDICDIKEQVNSTNTLISALLKAKE